MHSLFKFFVAAAAVATGLTHARPLLHSGFVVHEKREVPAQAWVKRGAVAPDALLPMKIGLKQQNLHLGYEYLMDV